MPHQSTRQTIICEQCGTPFSVKSYRATVYRAKYCSRACAGHRVRGAQSLAEAFHRSLGEPEPSGCIPWAGCISGSGYGCIRFKGANYQAPRLAWILAVGPIKGDLCICHKCDNPKCVNFRHMFLGTRQANNTDRAKKFRGNETLTDLDVQGIRGLVRVWGYSQGQVARLYKVNATTISRIMLGKAYTHVADAPDESLPVIPLGAILPP